MKSAIKLAQQVRKHVGRIKCRLVDEMPYAAAMERMPAVRRALLPMLTKIEPVELDGSGAVEIHMLCGKGSCDMGIWSSWSFLRFIPNGRLYLHSDGSLGHGDIEEWRRIIPDLQFVSREERDERVERLLPKSHAASRRWRESSPYSCKVFDFHVFGRSSKVLLLDSDVLCFRYPGELLAALADPAVDYAWNEDVRTCYPLPAVELANLFEQPVCERFNSGLVVAKRFGDREFEDVERILRVAEGSLNTSGWFEQTLYALLASKSGCGRPLGADCRVTVGQTAESCVVRHFVGVPRVRPRFFEEGVPRLIRQIETDAANRSPGAHPLGTPIARRPLAEAI